MTSDPIDPFKEEKKKRKRLLDEAMGGSARRFFEEEQKRRKLLDDAMGGSVRHLLEEEQNRKEFFAQSAIGKAAQGIIDSQRQQERLLEPLKSGVIQDYFAAEDARQRAFYVGSLASTKAFQDNIASAMASLVEPYSKVSKHLRESGVLDRIAKQQSALIEASTGISTQFEATQSALQDAIPTASQISASFGAQSALAGQMRRISEQIGQLDRIAISGGITQSAVWDTMRDTYGLSDEMSVSQAFLEIGTKLEQPNGDGKSLGVYEAWQLIQFLWLVFSVYAMIAGWGDYTDDDRARDEATAETIERIEARQQMRDIEAAIAEASAIAEMARINELPRAVVKYGANVRASPAQNAERIARLGKDQTVAIEEKGGRWLRIIFADSFNQELAEGWVWGGSLELVASDPSFAEQMEVAERIMREDRDILRELAK